MTYLLDTCAWLQGLLEPECLTSQARDILSSPDRVGLCSVSLLEAALLFERKRIGVRTDFQKWLSDVALPKSKITLLPLHPDVAAQSISLPTPFSNKKGEPHKDPFDRIITATARLNHLSLLTSDQILLNYAHLDTVRSRK